MKKPLLLLLFLICFGCKHESIEKTGTTALFLREISVNGKTDQRFEYVGNALAKEKSFGFCVETPTDEVSYLYKNGKLFQLSNISRSMYSSLSASCDPALGMRFDETYEYDSQNRLSKVSRSASYTEYFYNAQGKVEKEILFGGSSPAVTAFKYDSRGNLIEETNPSGNVSQYQYDNKTNPFYLINQKPGWISPFNSSPNNVIKGTGSKNFVRQLEYNAEGLPSQVIESNGLIYTYHY